MHNDDTFTSATFARMQEGAKQNAALREDAATDKAPTVEHIRGMVAATMGKLSADAADTAQTHAVR